MVNPKLLLLWLLGAATILPIVSANISYEPVNKSMSVLKNFGTNGKLFTTPYPYIVIEDALDPDLYKQLADDFLTDLDILRLNGKLVDLSFPHEVDHVHVWDSMRTVCNFITRTSPYFQNSHQVFFSQAELVSSRRPSARRWNASGN